MPALLPPSMQISGIAPSVGAGGGVPGVFAAPEQPPLVLPTPFTPATIIQQVSAATTVVTPASLAITVASTGAGNPLVLLAAVAGTGTAPTINAPAGWLNSPGSIGGNAANTLAGVIKFLPGSANPGGITSVTLTLTNANGCAAAFYELDDNAVTGTLDPAYGNSGSQNYTTSNAAPTIGSYTPIQGPVLLIGFECDVTGQAYTPANVGGTWIADTTATSTTGATLVVIRPFHQVTTPTGVPTYQLAGSLAGAIANGISLASFLLFMSAQISGVSGGQVEVDQGAGYANSILGAPGWALGGPVKAGGNGLGY